MQPVHYLDLFPLWAVILTTVLVSLLAVELGFRLGKHWQRRTRSEKEGQVGAMAGATLALLAFLLAFVTGLAVNRFDNRRALVLGEANAIGTTYLRAGFLDTPIDSESRALLREYVDVRLAALDPAKLTEARVRSEEIHTELWSRAEQAAEAHPDSEAVGLYIQSLNEVIDIHAMRVIAVTSSRIPGSIWLGVCLVVVLTMLLVGMHGSYGERENWPSLVLLALVFAAVFTLIVDLDRPLEGMLTVNQQALFDLREQLR